MEAFAVQANVVLDLKDSGKCKQRPPEHVEHLVTKKRHVGPHAAAMEYNLTAPKDLLISSQTFRTWLYRWRKEGNFWVAIIKNAIIKNAKGTVFKFDRF